MKYKSKRIQYKYGGPGQWNESNRSYNGNYLTDQSTEDPNNKSSFNYGKAASFATQAGTGILRTQNGPGDNTQRNANSVNAVADSAIQSYTPWGSYAYAAKGIGQSFVPTETTTDINTGHTVTRGTNDTNEQLYNIMTPTHTSIINEASKGTAEGIGTAILDGGTGGFFGRAMDKINNTKNKDFDETKSQENINNKNQQAQQSDYNNMMNFYKSQQANQVQQSKFGGHLKHSHKRMFDNTSGVDYAAQNQINGMNEFGNGGNMDNKMTLFNGGFRHDSKDPRNVNEGIPQGSTNSVQIGETKGPKLVSKNGRKSATANYIFSDDLYC